MCPNMCSRWQQKSGLANYCFSKVPRSARRSRCTVFLRETRLQNCARERAGRSGSAMEAFSRRGNKHAGFLLDCGPRTTPRCRHAAASRSCFTSQENCLAWGRKDRAPQKTRPARLAIDSGYYQVRRSSYCRWSLAADEQTRGLITERVPTLDYWYFGTSAESWTGLDRAAPDPPRCTSLRARSRGLDAFGGRKGRKAN